MDKPWLNERLRDKSWSRKVRSNSKRAMIFTWAFAGVWNVMAFPMAPLTWNTAAGYAGWEALLGLLFPVVGIGLIWYAVRKSRQWRRYGVTELTLDPYPGSIGGHVGGSIEVAAHMVRGHDYEVTLECLYSYMSGSGKNRSRRYDVRWQARGPAEVSTQGARPQLVFRFDVPAGLPASEKKRGSYHLWRVQLTGDQQDLPLDRTFEIAVFPTAEHSRRIQVDTTAAGRQAAAEEISGALASASKAAALRREVGLSIEQRQDWLRLLFHPGRQKFLGLMLIGFGAVFVGVGFAAGADAMTRWIFAVVGLGCLGVGLYVPCNSLDVRISPREIKRIRTWAGLVIRRQSIRPDQLRKLEIAKGASTYVNDKTTVYYRLIGRGSFGKFRLADGLPDRTLVEAIRDQVMRYAGLECT